MTKDFPVPPPDMPLVIQDLETGMGHIAWRREGLVYVAESCRDDLIKPLYADVREASVSTWCGRCASEMIHE